MVWKPRRSLSGLVGTILIILVLAADGALLFCLTSRSVDLLFFILALAIVSSLPVLILLAYRTYGFFNLRYLLDRNGLIITWADTQQIIPLGNITRIVKEVNIEDGWRQWLSWWMGQRGEVKGIGPVLFYATCPPAQQLLVVTPGVAYGISPEAPEEFIAAFEVRRRLGPTRSLAQESHRARLRNWPIWGDKGALLLMALGFLANLALFAYICWRYPALPQLLPLHWDAFGQVDRIGTRSQLFSLPAIGLAALLTNCSLGFSIHGRERIGAYCLLGGAIVVQFLFWLATLNIVA
ncbi:MAG: PH domain-containing protein [Chloroflexota bacterium]|nr:PH domain-containing protein [Chloroflexota bacterium]